MSQQQFYETVQREQEWEHDMKLKTFADNIREELKQSDELYSDLYEEDQKYLIQEQIDEYERLTK